MINFRYHVVSIIGIFIALAVGVVLGAGPLQSRIQAGVSTSSSTAATDPQVSARRRSSWPQGSRFVGAVGLPGWSEGCSRRAAGCI